MITDDKLIDLISGCIEMDALGRQSIHVSKLSKECYELAKQMAADFLKWAITANQLSGDVDGFVSIDSHLVDGPKTEKDLVELYLKSKEI